MDSRKKVRIIAAIVVLAIILTSVLGLVLSIVASANSSGLEALEKELSKIQSDKDKLDAEIESLNESLSSNWQKKQNLEKEIELIQGEILVINKLINSLDSDITNRMISLRNAEEALESQFNSLKKRIRVMYESGETTYLDVLLTSDDFYQMLSRIEIVSQIVEYDRVLLRDYTENRDSIKKQKEELEKQKEKNVSLRQTLSTQTVALKAVQVENDIVIETLQSEKELIQGDLDAIEKAERQVEDRIQKLVLELSSNGKDYVGGTYLWPLPGYTRISSQYGMRKHPVLGSHKLHTGTDLPAPKGTKILAANDGTVVTSEYNKAWGNYVMIDHGGGMLTLYAHMSERLVSVGTQVSRGQSIGLVGSTGYSTGNHLHFETRVNGVAIDAMSYFKKN